MRLSRKEWMRQVAQEAFEDAEEYGVPVIVLPTIYKLRCTCGHFASIAVPRHRVAPKFRCRECGSTAVRRVV
jgi:predicted SprT family Zn-dependent metalloprotease